MLTKFSVNNFKSFNDEFVVDLKNSNGYNFNKKSVNQGIVENAIVYGKNGIGKSNLGLAIFDIIDQGPDTLKLNPFNKNSAGGDLFHIHKYN